MSALFEFTLHAGPRRRELCPVSIPLPEPPHGSIRLVDAETGRSIPAQIDASGTTPALVAIVDTLDPGKPRRFRLESAPEQDAGVRLDDGDGQVEVRIGGSSFTIYHYGEKWVRPFLAPVIGPYGAGVTRGYPVYPAPGETDDHPHHKSIWIAHGELNGTDNWSEEPGHAWQIHRRFNALESGPVFGRIAEELDWVNREKTEVVLKEDREIRIYALPDSMRIVDLKISLTAPGKPVLFGDTKEAGLLSVRVATSMDGTGSGRIETGEGAIGEAEAWGKKAPWCDYAGPVATPWGMLWSGIALFDHPGNLRYPTNWHVRDYGLMTANCFGLHDFFNLREKPGDYTLPAGESLVFRYRIYIHPGDAFQGQVGAKFQDYINPPAAGR